MSLSSYLASKYLTAEPSPSSSGSKKRKRKTPSSTSGLIIADDDALGWSNTQTDNNEDDDSPLVASTPGSSTFRKSQKNAWKVVGAPAPKDSDLDAATADAIIASTASENAAAAHLDEAPAIADDNDRPIVRMSDGTHAGLQTAASVAAQLAARKKAETEAWEAEERMHGKHKRGKEETVYRDATGRRIDISMARASARAEADAKLAKEKQEKEEQLGDIQRAAKARRKEELEEAKFMPLARTIDDEDLNRELKQRMRWDDPAAQFLSREKLENQGRGGGGGGGGGGDELGSGKAGGGGKPVYKGAAPPNRYGIRPGYRWDGVDRGNGWESERFKAINRRERNKGLDFAWQMDE
jgi:pre-mRNA-splicing factor CWC26